MGEPDSSASGPSLEPSGDAVKTPLMVQKPAPEAPGFARYFDGWQLGAITVSVVLATALLAVPRAARPGAFPVPLVDAVEERRTRARYDELADRAEREGLPFETRAVGDAVRKLGLALGGRSGDPEHRHRLLQERVRSALAAGQHAELSRLRAVQARLFVRAVRAHDWRGEAAEEVLALGGDFVARAARNGWVDAGGWVASDAELRTLFALRWLELTRLQGHPDLRASLAELRRYYRFLLLYPERGASAEAPPVDRARQRLRYVEALARRDHDYPAALARGSLLAELGMTGQSAQALSGYLASPSGEEWLLRARNYLLYAAAGHEPEPDP